MLRVIAPMPDIASGRFVPIDGQFKDLPAALTARPAPA
jgi:hypothetical protein